MNQKPLRQPVGELTVSPGEFTWRAADRKVQVFAKRTHDDFFAISIRSPHRLGSGRHRHQRSRLDFAWKGTAEELISAFTAALNGIAQLEVTPPKEEEEE